MPAIPARARGDAPPILVVTHDATRALELRRALSRDGLSNPVRTARSLARARTLFAGPGPEPVVVVVDLRLPEGTALQLLAELRGGLSRRVPVVVFGDGATDAEVSEVHRLGAEAYLSGQVAAHALVDVIRGLRMPWTITRAQGA